MTVTRDYACVIHGDFYQWAYVEKLYNMLCRNSGHGVSLHVFTEPSRSVPDYMIQHPLVEWPGVSGPKKSWWYKMQMFSYSHLRDPVVYFDLDVVILRNIDWIWQLDQQYFWAVQDFRYLRKPGSREINSSIMFWNPTRFSWIWDDFVRSGVDTIIARYPGDQNYLDSIIPHSHLRFLDRDSIKSYRWQIQDKKSHAGQLQQSELALISKKLQQVDVLVFHGTPKPHEINELWLADHWK
jgi:hypothetical protein